MFDIGSWEFLVVIVVALIVIGPKDLPAVVRSVREWVRRARELAREFQSGLEDMAREVELDKFKDEITADLDIDGVAKTIKDDIRSGVDPDGAVSEALTMDDDWTRLDGKSTDLDVEPEPTIADPDTIGRTAGDPDEGGQVEIADSEAPEARPAKPDA